MNGCSRAAVPTAAAPRGSRHLRLAEADLRGDLGLRRCLEEGIFLEAEHLRRQVRRELTARRVVGLDGFVVAHALDGDAVLGAGELVHQPVELFVRLELRIVLDYREPPAESGRTLVRP